MIALILTIALEVGVDGRLAVLVARTENAALDPVAIGITGDLGIMQLNPRYLDYHVEKYWDKDWEFDWRDPYDNIYIGLHHLKYLLSIPGFNDWMSIMAYNCGEGAVRGGAPPMASIEYANVIYIAWRENRYAK